MARIVYFIDHLNYGDDDERSGWYLMRATVADDRGAGIGRGTVMDRKPIALFDRTTEGSLEARTMQDAAKAGVLHVMPRDWNLESIAALDRNSK